jgi:hypothetical protein
VGCVLFCFDFWGGLYCFNFLFFTLYCFLLFFFSIFIIIIFFWGVGVALSVFMLQLCTCD